MTPDDTCVTTDDEEDITMFVDDTTLEVSSSIQGSPILVTPQSKSRDFFDLQGNNIMELNARKMQGNAN